MRFLKSNRDTAEEVMDGYHGEIKMEGDVALKKLTGLKIPSLDGDITIKEIREFATPHNALDPEVCQWKWDNQVNIGRGLNKIILAKEHEIPTMWGTLWLKKIEANGNEIDYGIGSLRVVTTVGVNYLAGTVLTGGINNMKYHGLGTNNTAENVADTTLNTELTTEYNPDNTRATGTQTTGAANVYVTVATNTVDAIAAVVEHGVFSAATAGILLDRSVFAVLTLQANDGVQSTYSLTLAAGG